MKGPLRILHCPGMIAGNPQGIARAERELGLQSWAVTLAQNKWQFASDEVLMSDSPGPLRSEARLWRLVFKALRNYDIIHYNVGSSLIDPLVSRHLRTHGTRYPKLLRLAHDVYRRVFGMNDVALLKRAGKVVFVTYQGTDARQVDYCKANFAINNFTDIDQESLGPALGNAD